MAYGLGGPPPKSCVRPIWPRQAGQAGPSIAHLFSPVFLKLLMFLMAFPCVQVPKFGLKESKSFVCMFFVFRNPILQLL